MTDDADTSVTRRWPGDDHERTEILAEEGAVMRRLPPAEELTADEVTVALPADTSVTRALPPAPEEPAGGGACAGAAPSFAPAARPYDPYWPHDVAQDQPCAERPPAASFDAPTAWLPPAPGWDQVPPPRTSYAAKRRRRWPAFVLVLLLLIPTALGGFALGRAFGGGDVAPVQEYAHQAPGSQDSGFGQLPDSSGGVAPDSGQSQYDNPWPGDSSGSSGSGAATMAGPSDEEVASLAEAVSPGLVNIEITTAYDGGRAAGSGIVLTSSGEVLTNNHVIERAASIRVTSVGTGRTYSATVLGYDRSHDIALLQIEGASDLPTATLGESSAVRIGDQIVVLGNAGGDGGQPDAMGGVVTALDQDIVASGPSGAERLIGLIEVDADVRSGQSGGATVNSKGEVIGVTTAASAGYSFDQDGGTGYAVPIDQALAIVEQIRAGSSSDTVHVGETGFLGVQVASAGGNGGYGRSYDSGATVAGVLPDTPAEKAGLQAGDVITAVDGQTVDSASHLTSLLGRHRPGDTVRISWTDRYGETHSESVTLASGPPG